MDRTQLAFTILAFIIVFSMIAATVSYALIETNAFDSADDDDVFENSDVQGDLEAQARAAVEARPDDPRALSNLANLLANLGNPEESITWYERALAVTPDDASLRLDFAQTLVSANKPNDAELQFEKAIELDPNNPQSHYYLAELYQMWDPPRSDDAIAAYLRVIEVGPDTYVADQSREQLVAMGVATPSPAASPARSPGEEET
ncbi:MAG: tetratricopeptide repeat protein [Thermomicrobiales bacterium]